MATPAKSANTHIQRVYANMHIQSLNQPTSATRLDFQWRDWDTNPATKIFQLTIFWSARWAGVKVAQNLWEWLTSD